MMHELSRSSDSSRTNSRELLEVVLHKKDDDDRHRHHLQHQQHQPHQLHSQHLQQLHQHRSVDSSSRLSAMLVRTTHLTQNNLGDLSRGPSSFSRKSLSRQSLDSNSHVSDTCETRAHHHACAAVYTCNSVGTFLNSLGLLALASLILAAMSMLLLATLSQETTEVKPGQYVMTESVGTTGGDERGVGHHGNGDSDTGGDLSSRELPKPTSSKTRTYTDAIEDDSDGPENRRPKLLTSKVTLTQSPSPSDTVRANSSAGMQSLLEAAIAMATLVMVADLCCLMVCSMQCFFASKLLNTNDGDERSVKYLRECSSSRFIAVMGFFLSIPAFLVALMLGVLLRLTPGPALTSCVMLGVGVLFCVLSVMQNVYHWRVEKSRADDGLPVYESQLLLRHRPPPAPSPSRTANRGTSRPPSQPPLSPPTLPKPPQGDVDSGEKNELSTLV